MAILVRSGDSNTLASLSKVTSENLHYVKVVSGEAAEMAALAGMEKEDSVAGAGPSAVVAEIGMVDTILDSFDKQQSFDSNGELGFYYPLMMSCVAGAATGVGAMFVFFLDKHPSGSHLAFALSLAAGVMLSVSIVDMYIPLVLEDGIFWPSIVASLGAVTFQVFENLLPSQEDSVLLPTHVNGKHEKKVQSEKARNLRLAIVMMLTLTAHNFPEGLAVSVSNLNENQPHGIIITVAIAVHNIPEGLAIATPFFAATGSRFYSVLMAFMSGLSEPFGALIALTFLRPMFQRYPWLVHYVLCYVAGVMTAVSCLELLPEARRYHKPSSVKWGFTTGVLVMLLTMLFV